MVTAFIETSDQMINGASSDDHSSVILVRSSLKSGSLSYICFSSAQSTALFLAAAVSSEEALTDPLSTENHTAELDQARDQLVNVVERLAAKGLELGREASE